VTRGRPAGPPRLLCVGLSCLDLVWRVSGFPPRSSRTEATAHHRHGGGPAATAAVAAARYGVETRLWAIHGDDPAGEELAAELAAEGIDLAGVRVPPNARTFVSAVLVVPSGERWIFPYRGEGLADDPADWPLETAAQVDAVLTDLRHPRLSRAVLSATREAGVPSVVDLGWLRDVELAAQADVLIAAREAADEALARDGIATPDASLAAEAALASLRSRDGQTVAITLGEEGVIYDAGEGLRHLPALPTDVHDTTGAGDVFHGVWAAALASGLDADSCARHASVAAALACRAPGRASIPSGDEVRLLLERRTVREMNERHWA